MTGYVINCLVISKEKSGKEMFIGKGDDVFCQLDGYAIIPMSNYVILENKALIADAAIVWRNSWADAEDLQEAESGCKCEVCQLIRACDEYKEKVKK